ncbi:MAG: hypothetical protein COV74_01305 [Candidatus Omnitrophica bacterium CG11_big_fil_rev_8_21_14_0_20_45_26]|uniref:Uncharacterized protein n=1 Tax=Candidatus Abzuiibacterium crystallinum TaxID=1974748 RepID=A0A2H0LS47_9BACT|nr:MAG: hypothetical protein COV74_01305 [Candidatus Omnitrophica bacterium CG11_big_fil_rev_8_21_14_0_20_45_26]PIW64807.1 MAG: hypothetical protein COW12_04715 [Candidatus Omnitrophica bacterium CG12_big_fil_rev_8_21_14_0_65_45_16]
MKTRFQERLERMGRRYYEVFGDLESEVEFLKLAALILLAFLFLSLFGAFLVGKRPPLVIRVTDVGEAQAVRNIPFNNEVTEPELIYFAQTFTRRFTEYNAYTLARDLAEAFNQMTGRYQVKVKRELLESGLLARVREAGLHATVEFKEKEVTRNSSEVALVSLIGVRSLASYKNPDYRESALFKAELVLKKVTRSSETPAGLLVEEYREITLNKLEADK